MRARDRVCAALVLCVATSAAFAKEPAAPAGDCWLAAFKAGNADAVSACYADDAVLWLSGVPMAKGRTAIRDTYAGFFAAMTIKDASLALTDEKVMGDTRVGWGTYSISVVDKASKAESVVTGRYTDVQKKIGGRWQYIVDHPSDDPAPAAREATRTGG